MDGGEGHVWFTEHDDQDDRGAGRSANVITICCNDYKGVCSNGLSRDAAVCRRERIGCICALRNMVMSKGRRDICVVAFRRGGRFLVQ